MPDIFDQAAGRPTRTELGMLLARYQRDGDRHARERAIQVSMPLARRLAFRYYRRREPLDDLVQVAYLGLVKAVDRFDPDRGVAFATFATPTILGELRRHFRDTTWAMHVPRMLHDATLAVETTRERMYRATGRTPSARQLAAATGLSDERVAEALRVRGVTDVLSLQSGAEEESVPLIERLGHPDEGYEAAEQRVMLGEAIPDLSEDERQALALRFIDDLTQRQIAARMGVSRMQVSRILHGALEMLARRMRTPADGVMRSTVALPRSPA